MDFCRTIYHVVQQGDTFYRLAQRYHTTVPDIIMRNPGVNPYNLQVGTRLRICTGYEDDRRQPEIMDLNNDMREAWSLHNLWTAMFLVSLFDDLDNKEAVQARLMQTPEDIAEVFNKFYTSPVVQQLKALLEEHVRLAGEMAAAMQDHNAEQTRQLETRMNQNGDEIARLLADNNPKYDYEELRNMLRMHMDLMHGTMEAQQNGNYGEAVRLTDENGEQLMKLADALTNGLMEQFYQK